MEENTFRHVFSLSGITGMLIATVLLLSILAGLTWWGIIAQQGVMQEPYRLVKPTELKMNSTQNASHMQIKKGK